MNVDTINRLIEGVGNVLAEKFQSPWIGAHIAKPVWETDDARGVEIVVIHAVAGCTVCRIDIAAFRQQSSIQLPWKRLRTIVGHPGHNVFHITDMTDRGLGRHTHAGNREIGNDRCKPAAMRRRYVFRLDLRRLFMARRGVRTGIQEPIAIKPATQIRYRIEHALLNQ